MTLENLDSFQKNPPQSTVLDGDDGSFEKISKKRVSLGDKLGVITIFVCAAVVFPSYHSSLREDRDSRLSDLHLKKSKSISFSVYNEYTETSPIVNYPWEFIVEPHRESTFYSIQSGGTAESYIYSWNIDGTTLQGANVTHTFTKLGKHPISVVGNSNSKDADESDDLSHDGEVMVKYVRREMRSLTDEDRELFFDAMVTVYNVGETEGKALYGDAYLPITYFARMHLKGSAAKDCDHWHDGAGIMVHHMSFTLAFEAVLQAINPSISMPYWEYSLDAYNFGSKWFQQSEMFEKQWFGEVHTNDSVTHAVPKGRWAYTPIMADASSYSPIYNAWGLLRSPWNEDPTPYLTRSNSIFSYLDAGYTTLPECSTLMACFVSETVTEMNVCLNGDTHGPVHIMMGGQFHTSVNQTDIVNAHWAQRIQLLVFKSLWRMGYAVCPSSCSSETTSQDECQCSCPAVDDPYKVLVEDSGVMHWIDDVSPLVYFDEINGVYKIRGYHGDKLTQAWHDLLQAFCNPAYVGDLYTSNAPADPLFWVIHTAGERLMSWRRILSYTDKMPLDETWGYEHPSGVPSDTGTVCDWSKVTKDDEMPECDKGLCTGHAEDDILPTDVMGETYTNIEFYHLMNPYNEDLPYLYDNFDYSHCEAQGVHLSVDSFFHDN